MTQVILKRNDPDGPVPLIFDRTWTATDTDTDSATSSRQINVQQLLYGVAFVSTTVGIQVKIDTRTADPAIPGDTDHYTITLDTPWGTWTSGDVHSFLTSATTRLEIDGAYVTGSCAEITFGFSELRFYVGAVLKKTISGTTQTVTGWSEILMGLWLDTPTASMNPMPNFSAPTCAATWAGELPGYTHETTQTSRTEIKRSGSHINIDFDQSESPPTNSCGDCDEITQYSVNWNGTDTTYVEVSARLYDYRLVTDDGVGDCYCDPGPTIVPATGHLWHIFRKVVAQAATYRVRGWDQGVYGYQFERSSQCSPADPILYDTDVTEVHSFCDFTRPAQEARGTTYCYQILTPGICGSDGGGGDS